MGNIPQTGMRKISQVEYDSFPIVDGYKQCPTGDYSLIEEFGGQCNFGERCSFGEFCSFGRNCRFGEQCSFGWYCSFGEYCEFGTRSSFGPRCSFGRCCSFGASSSFGLDCAFGESCSFGKDCSFENGRGIGNSILQIRAGSKDRTSTAYNLDTGIYVRSGCFIGTLEEFEKRVNRVHGANAHGKTYRLWIEIIKVNFGKKIWVNGWEKLSIALQGGLRR